MMNATRLILSIGLSVVVCVCSTPRAQAQLGGLQIQIGGRMEGVGYTSVALTFLSVLVHQFHRHLAPTWGLSINRGIAGTTAVSEYHHRLVSIVRPSIIRPTAVMDMQIEE